MRIEEIKKVCFVGAGTMGCYNSLLAGIAGYETVLYDISVEALAAGRSWGFSNCLCKREIREKKQARDYTPILTLLMKIPDF